MNRKMAKLKISGRLLRKKARRLSFSPKKHCRFCSNVEIAQGLDYKNVSLLKGYLTERGKILQARVSGVCSKHQRVLSHCIKKARVIALLPYRSAEF